MYIPKTIINKLIPFFSKQPSRTILKQAKASVNRQQAKSYIEVSSDINWARVWSNKLGEENFLSEPTQFIIEQENLEEIGYHNSLQEAALGFIEEAQVERLKELAELAEDFPRFDNPYKSGNEELSVSVQLLELKKIVDLAVAVAEVSQMSRPTISLSLKTDSSPIYWKLNAPIYGELSTYLADGVLMPLKVNREH